MDASHVLLIEDEPVDAARVRRSLRARPDAALALEHVTTLQAGLERLARGDIDAVLLDLNLPDSRGIDTVVRLHEPDPSLPIVVFTGEAGDELALAALAAGAQDYLVKDELDGSLLQRAIRYAIERSRSAKDRAQLERRAHQVEKMESLGALCAGLGFGFNPLIGSIFDHCDDALVSLEIASRESHVRRDLLEIHRAAFRAAEIVQRLRDYGAIEQAQEGQVDLARFAFEASELLAAIVAREIDIVCDVSGEPILVDLTRPELHRLMVSLVVNAAEAIGGVGGAISITIGLIEADAALLAQTRGWPDPKPGTHAFLRVADHGPGLGAVRRERIFDPFYTTKYAGRGLGLAGVLGILQRRKAVVHVDENRPVGTVFTLLFPRSAERSC